MKVVDEIETFPPFLVRQGALSPSDLSLLRSEAAMSTRSVSAAVLSSREGEAVIQPDVRKGVVVPLTSNYLRETGLAEKLRILCDEANQLYYGAELSEGLDEVRLNVYGVGAHYSTWHRDLGPSSANTRKLTMAALIEASADLEGGELQIFDGLSKTIPLEPGDIVLFPSFIYHRVSPVLRGRRVSLVTWVHGPRWR